MRENASLLKKKSDKFVSIIRCLDFFTKTPKILYHLGIKWTFRVLHILFCFFLNEEISSALTIFFIRCGISAIKRLVHLLLDEGLHFKNIN